MKDKQFGEMIKSRRTQLKLTQEELANKLGYKSKSTINKIELGINSVSQKKIVKFADALDTTVAYLMGWTDDPNKRAPEKLYEIINDHYESEFYDTNRARKLDEITDEEIEIIYKYQLASDDIRQVIKKILDIHAEDYQKDVTYSLL